jgi:hypothetical protein
MKKEEEMRGERFRVQGAGCRVRIRVRVQGAGCKLERSDSPRQACRGVQGVWLMVPELLIAIKVM